MHIGIDYTAAVWQGAGIGRYTRELTRAVIAQGSEHRYTLFYAAGGIGQSSPYLAELRQLCVANPAIRAVPIPIAPRRLTQIWQRLRLPMPIELFTGRLDVLHAPDFVLPPTRARTLLTIHDLSFLVHPELAAPGNRRGRGPRRDSQRVPGEPRPHLRRLRLVAAEQAGILGPRRLGRAARRLPLAQLPQHPRSRKPTRTAISLCFAEHARSVRRVR